MANEFKFRALTNEDWKDIEDKDLTAEGGLRLKKDKGDGCYISKSLDSGKEGCRWHRIVLDADVPENSTITVFFYSSDKEEAAKSWYGTLVFKKVNDDFKNPKDALVQTPPGRYISLKIDFHSEGRESPVLRQVKIYYPRLSYLRYLPAVYQEESASKDLLERFLSIFESALHDSEETISWLPMYFDPMATQAEFVPWLASWLSLDLYELLGDKNREFILRAVEFYKQKGTVSGIAALVSFLTGKKCCVKEYMNNVFRSYGMEHDEEDEIVDISECRKNIERTAENIICTKFHRKTSKTVNTAKLDLLANMGKYCDEVHYVTDTSKDGRYSPHVIGLFIFLDAGEKLVIDEDELHKIINSFLPVFVRAEIITVEGPLEEFKDVGGVYKDNVNWNWLYTNTVEGRTNDLQYRTPHSKIGMELTL
jgi:phage tail-like protein